MLFYKKIPFSLAIWYRFSFVFRSLKVLRSILAILSNVPFWTEFTDVIPGVCQGHFYSLGHNFQCSSYQWDYFGFHFPYLPQYFLYLFIFLPFNIPLIRYCPIYFVLIFDSCILPQYLVDQSVCIDKSQDLGFSRLISPRFSGESPI